LHKRVTVAIDGQEFKLRVSGRKCKVGGEVGTPKNRESFDNVFTAMRECQDPTAKFLLLNLMNSLDPERTKGRLAGNEDNLGPFQGIFDPDGRPSDALFTLDTFKSHLSENGVDIAQLDEMTQSIYETLKLGRLGGKIHGGERERLDFSRSNFARGLASMEVLSGVTSTVRTVSKATLEDTDIDTFLKVDDGQERIFRQPNRAEAFPLASMQFPTGSSIHFDEGRRSFVNANRTMEAWLSTSDRDENGVPQKIPIAEGRRLGLITPEKAQELETLGLPKFTPLYVSFGPTASFADVKADAKNIVGGVPQNVRDADVLARTITDHLEPGVVPIFIGLSMGGMLAHAVGAEHNCASIGFNPLGLGEGVREFIDRHAVGSCKQANDVAHAECHPSFAMVGDWVSDEEGSKVASLFVKKPYIGQRYMMPILEESGLRGMGMMRRHVRFYQNIAAHFARIDRAEGGAEN
jgi:hypothetical protein